MDKWVELLIGIVLVVLPILASVNDWFGIGLGTAAIEFIKGGVIVLIVLIGLLFVLLGISDMKS